MNRPIRNWQGQRLWIIGASSGIGAALAQQALDYGAIVTLSARRVDKLALIANGHPNARLLAFDVSELDAFPAAYKSVCSTMGAPDLVLFVPHNTVRSAVGKCKLLRLNLVFAQTYSVCMQD